MAFAKTELLNQIKSALVAVSTSLKLGGATNMLDDHVAAEDFFAGLLNEVYGWRLENLNKSGRSYPGIDLGDEANRIAVQVTTELNTQKIKHTLEQSDQEKFEDVYDELYMLVMVFRDNPYRSRASFTSKIEFDPAMHILTLDKLYRTIADITDLPRLENINRYLEKHLTIFRDRFVTGLGGRDGIFSGVPQLPGHFVDREDVVAQLVDKLIRREGDTVPPVSLHGIPGSGKTTLAVAVGHHRAILAHFSDGVLWAGLGLVGDPMVHLAGWGTALGGDISNLADLKQRQAAVRRMIGQKKLLLVIDDVWELEAAGALKVGGPNCAHLLTTRDQIIARQFAGAKNELTVESFDDDKALELLSALAPEVVQSNPEAAQELVRAVGGLPLALELLGGYLSSKEEYLYPELFPELSAAAYEELADPQKRLALARSRLGGDSAEVSLKETIELSLRVLPEEAQRAFYCLGAFSPKPAVFSREAAGAVTETGPRAMALLASRNLVGVVGGHFAIHQVLADVAGQESTEGADERHKVYYLELVNRDREDWRTIEAAWPQIQRAWRALPADRQKLEWLEAAGDFMDRRGLRREHIRWIGEALDVVQATPELRHEQGRLSLDLGVIYLATGQPGEAIEIFREALERSEAESDPEGIAAAQTRLGAAHHDSGQFKAAMSHFTDAFYKWNELGNKPNMAAMALGIGAIHGHWGQLDKALEFIDIATPVFKDVNARRSLATAYGHYFNLLDQKGMWEEADEYLGLAGKIFADMGDRAGLASNLSSAGKLLFQRGKVDMALEKTRDALQIFMEIDDQSGAATALNNLGVYHLNTGRSAEAQAYFTEALEARRKSGDVYGLATVLNNMGLYFAVRGQYAEALEHFAQAMSVRDEIGDLAGLAVLHLNVGDVHFRQGSTEEAETAFRRGLELFERVGDRAGTGRAYGAIGVFLVDQGRFAEAGEMFTIARTLQVEIGDRSGEGFTLQNIATNFSNQGLYKEAITPYKQALETMIATKDPSGEAQVRRNYGNTLWNMGRKQEGYRQVRRSAEIRKALNHPAYEETRALLRAWKKQLDVEDDTR